jgi:hypothetical protein
VAETIAKSGLQSLLSGELIPLIPQPHLLKNENELHHYLEKLQDYIRRLLAAITLENITNEPPTPLPPGVGKLLPTAWRYDAATNKFQHKLTQVQFLGANAEGGWVDITDGNQPLQLTQVVNTVLYDPVTHELSQAFTTLVNVLSYDVPDGGPIGDITPFPPPPPTTVDKDAVVDWRYDGTTHKFQYKKATLSVIATSADSAWTDSGGSQPVQLARSVTNVDYNTTTHIISEDVRVDLYVLEMGAATTGINIDTADPCTP